MRPEGALRIDSTRLSIERSIWVSWVLVYVSATFIGEFLWDFGYQGLANSAFLLIPFGQWLILRRLDPRSFSWVVLTVVGIILGFVLALILGLGGATFPDLLLRGAVSGAVVGAMQWLFLRQRYQRAGWWIPASSLAEAVYVLLSSLIIRGIAGVITATVLIFLLRRPVGGETIEEILAE